jgi:hypothetical protein
VLLLYIIKKDIILACCFVDLAPGQCYSEGCRRQRGKEEIINEAIISGKEEGGSLRSCHDPRY